MGNNNLIVYNKYLKDIKYNLPENSKSMHKGTITSIKNAIGDGIVDSKGIIWFDSTKIHTILRVKTKNDAAYLLETIDSRNKASFNNKIYVRWSSLISIIAKRMEDKPKNKYLDLVFKALGEINSSDYIKILQIAAEDEKKENIKKLKKKRIKEFKIIKDELNNEVLDKKTAEFSHIRSVAFFSEVADKIWNGLIVNKDTHDIITKNNINDEEELYSLCIDMGWNLDWYNNYKEIIEKN
ncbi:MAG: hypothetical protein IJO26_01460 [Clostridium sp.]|nr:hypothetical protein [Clostridium sp.]